MNAGESPFAAAIDQESRRARVRGRPGVDGIDVIEVLSHHVGTPGHVPGAPEQCTLLLHLLNGPVPPGWDAEAVRIEGGVREDPALNPVSVVWAHRALALVDLGGSPRATLPDGVDPADAALVGAALGADAARDRALVVRTSSTGDWSTYTLRLVGPGGIGVPAGIDLPLSTAPFAFTVDCPSDFDCETRPSRLPVTEELLPGDYLARDFEALRTRLLDRLSALLPEWEDRNPADPAVMLTELFAALGDRLAYWQDAVAVEAYLGTARRRTSVRRHARLLGYRVHEGCSARTLLAVHVQAGTVEIPAGLPVTDLPAHPGTEAETPVDAADRGGTVFETCTSITAAAVRNRLDLYAWGDLDHCLPRGATAAFVATEAGTDPLLTAGDLLVLADCPPGGEPSQGDPALRFPVRLVADARRLDDPLDPAVWVWEVRWGRADALPAPLPVRRPETSDACAVAVANIVVADHGASIEREPLVPPTVTTERAYRPRLQHPGLAYADPDLPATAPARVLLSPDPRRATAAVRLDDGQRVWTPCPDLIASGRLDPHVVVEPEPGGVARLRFGDGLSGRTPAVGLSLRAVYRVGGGSVGNVAPDRLRRILARPGHPRPLAGVLVWNPLPAAGGADPEPLEQVRQLAPAAFRTQRRAVTSGDYAVVAEQHPDIQAAVSRRRWTGSWYAQEVTVDPVGAQVDRSGLASLGLASEVMAFEVLAALEGRRIAGVDVELGRPVYVALDLVLSGCVKPGYHVPDVEARLREVFSAGLRPDGPRGFFHPDRFSFGDPLRASDVVVAAMAVDGLAWVEPRRFARADAGAAQAAAGLATGVLPMQPRQLLRCDSDPNNPEAGRIEFSLGDSGRAVR